MLTYCLGNVELILESMEFQTNIVLLYNLGTNRVRYSSRHKETCRNFLRTLEEEDGHM
jgi:hypothetical protein